jgi:hypothetical protein
MRTKEDGVVGRAECKERGKRISKENECGREENGGVKGMNLKEKRRLKEKLC